MDRAAIVACPIMVVGVVMLCGTASCNRVETVMRIVVIGTSGAGKTILAKRVASALNLPCIELDSLHWGPITALVPPLKRPSDIRHTLSVLPALPKLSPLLRREPYPCSPLHPLARLEGIASTG